VVCEAYDEYLRYDWTQHIEGPQSAVTYSSRVTQGGLGDYRGFAEFLLRNLHYDGGWTTGPNGSQAYGLFGTHLTLARAGRVHLWGPPGMLVVRRPERKIEVKMTWGVDVFLAELPLPFGSHRLPLYVSFAKVFGAPEQQALQHKVNAGLDMLGFSVTLKR
jgi:hypothetical protein